MAGWPSRTLLLALFAVHCASPPPAPAAAAPSAAECRRQAVSLTLAASEQVNANAGARGLPVAVRVYQLQSDAKLRNATFEEVWQDDKIVLRNDLLALDEQTAYPGQTVHFKLELSPKATVIAAVALFREPKGKDWFVTFDLEPLREKPPCPVADPEISLWLDRWKIQDGRGHETRASGSPPL
jgi:type VI secretion system protein VasD